MIHNYVSKHVQEWLAANQIELARQTINVVSTSTRLYVLWQLSGATAYRSIGSLIYTGGKFNFLLLLIIIIIIYLYITINQRMQRRLLDQITLINLVRCTVKKISFESRFMNIN